MLPFQQGWMAACSCSGAGEGSTPSSAATIDCCTACCSMANVCCGTNCLENLFYQCLSFLTTISIKPLHLHACTILWCLILPILSLLPCEDATDEVSPDDSSLALPSACTALLFGTHPGCTCAHQSTSPSSTWLLLLHKIPSQLLWWSSIFHDLGCYQTNDQPASCLLQPMEEAPYDPSLESTTKPRVSICKHIMVDFALMPALAQADAIDYLMCPHLVTFSETYVNEENCHAQDNFQICMAIMASLLMLLHRSLHGLPSTWSVTISHLCPSSR